MQEPLDSVAAIVQHEDDGLQAMVNHDRQLLHRQLPVSSLPVSPVTTPE